MKRWQYRIEHQPVETQEQQESLQRLLNELGEKWWKATAVLPGPSIEFREQAGECKGEPAYEWGTHRSVLVFLRRPHPEDPAA